MSHAVFLQVLASFAVGALVRVDDRVNGSCKGKRLDNRLIDGPAQDCEAKCQLCVVIATRRITLLHAEISPD